METHQILLLCLCAGVFLVMGMMIYFGNHYSLNRIQSKVVGHGQHGTARFATKKEIHQIYRQVAYTPPSGGREKIDPPFRDWW